MPAVDAYRLPRTVVPSRYDITIEPDLDGGTFSGSEAVTVEVLEQTDDVVVNAEELEITEAWLEDGDGNRITASVTMDKEAERAHLGLDTPVDPGSYTLRASFHGTLNDKLVGFYRSTFTDGEGAKRVIATTQFEATHARKAFPCWDEPGFKATFAITLVVPEELVALSNGAELSVEPVGDGKRAVRFVETMPMSTYIVAFVVGPLEVTPPVMVDNTPVRVAHVPGKGDLTAYALEIGAAVLRYFADYYGIVYPADKLDMVALPDFAFGAMENLGCITYREVLLLVDPAAVSQNEQQAVADVIAHEIAHMWFGDLVTMKWWNGIWLNEAFATFMEMKATDHVRPDWERFVTFGLSRSAAYDVDSLDSTRPIEYEVVSPEDAEGMFDILTYEKGAAVVWMLEQFLGEETFRDGIRHYLATHQFGNTETTDLWDALETTSGDPVRRMMDSWIFQGGYPVVRAELVDGGKTLRLAQERFRFDDGDDTSTERSGVGRQWVVPVLLEYGHNGDNVGQRVILDAAEQDVELSFAADWVVVNAGGSGFYRVQYSPALLAALTHRGPNALTSLERYGLVDDAFASVLAGAVTAAEFLNFARSFADEPDVSVWQRLVQALGALDRLLDDDVRPRFQATVRGLVAPALQRLGWEPRDDESDRVRELRASLLEALGTLGDDETAQARARAIHDAYVTDPHAVDANLAAAAVTVLATTGGPDEYELFLGRHKSATTPQEELRYLYALGRFPDEELMARTLEFALNEVRTQNAPYLLRQAMVNRERGPQAWEFVRRHWDALMERLPDNSIVRMVEGVKVLMKPEVANDVFAFFAEHEVPQGAQSLAQHLERLRVNVALRDRESERFAAALSQEA